MSGEREGRETKTVLVVPDENARRDLEYALRRAEHHGIALDAIGEVVTEREALLASLWPEERVPAIVSLRRPYLLSERDWWPQWSRPQPTPKKRHNPNRAAQKAQKAARKATRRKS